MRVELSHNIADNARAFRECFVGAISAVEHCVEDSAVDRLEAVSHVGQCAPDDDAHGVIKVGALHLHLEINLFDAVDVVSHVCVLWCRLDVEEPNVFGVLLNEGSARANVFAHEC